MTTQSPIRQRTTRSTAHDPNLVQLRRRCDGSIEALSVSDGITRYAVSIGTVTSCECKGFARRGTCCHTIAAAARYAAFWAPPWLSTAGVDSSRADEDVVTVIPRRPAHGCELYYDPDCRICCGPEAA